MLEMQASLPSNESAFRAENAEVCHRQLSNNLAAPQYSLAELVKGLMADESTGLEMSKLTAFPLFLAIGGKDFSAFPTSHLTNLWH